jgi:hypothetical protein
MLCRLAPYVLSAVLATGGALCAPSEGLAQLDPNRANLSTGSGAGTSPGVNDSPSSTRTTKGSLIPPFRDDNPLRPQPDPYGMMGAADPSVIEAIDSQLLEQARRVHEPNERALALERVARSKILSSALSATKLDEAHAILQEAGDAVLSAPKSLVRELRIRQIVLSHMQLAEEELRQGLVEDVRPADATAEYKKYKPFAERAHWFDRSMASYTRATFMAMQLESSNYRSDLLYRLAESESGSSGSQSIVTLAGSADRNRPDLQDQITDLYRISDRAVVHSIKICQRISLYIWRDRALLTVAAAASASEQFPRAVEAAKLIPQPEYRADALIRVAEAQARKRFTGDATATYEEAARAVASIPLADPRSILASVLIDSLLAVGRYEDARMSILFYPDDERRLNALGAIAQSQGERGLASKARSWIDHEPYSWRPVLNRRVDDGMMAAIERRRSQSLPFGIVPGLERTGP